MAAKDKREVGLSLRLLCTSTNGGGALGERKQKQPKEEKSSEHLCPRNKF